MTTVDRHARLWEAERPRLTGLAYRILGSWHDAEDVVATAWARLAGQGDLDRPEAWLTTVVTRLSIDASRRARSRRETYVGEWLPEPVATGLLPEDAAVAGSLLGLGMLRLMDRLDPVDRAIFVLREAFDVPYDEIGECVDRSPAACRQVVRRARVKLRLDPDDTTLPTPDDSVDRRLLTALVNAVTSGEVAAVVRLVSEDCVLWADGAGRVPAARRPLVGAERVARFLVGIARLLGSVEERHVNGVPGLLFRAEHGSYLYIAEHDGTRITGIQVQANPDKLTASGGDSGSWTEAGMSG